MSYLKWFSEHAQKHKKIVQKLLDQGYDKESILEYFDFENMCEKEPDFCLLYKEHKKCHEIEPLNCYLCACPHFRFNDEGMREHRGATQYSCCDIQSKHGGLVQYGDAIHQNCTNCLIPHHLKYISKHFDIDWEMIMCDCMDECFEY